MLRWVTIIISDSPLFDFYSHHRTCHLQHGNISVLKNGPQVVHGFSFNYYPEFVIHIRGYYPQKVPKQLATTVLAPPPEMQLAHSEWVHMEVGIPSSASLARHAESNSFHVSASDTNPAITRNLLLGSSMLASKAVVRIAISTSFRSCYDAIRARRSIAEYRRPRILTWS